MIDEPFPPNGDEVSLLRASQPKNRRWKVAVLS
jgi:hypothetical protein